MGKCNNECYGTLALWQSRGVEPRAEIGPTGTVGVQDTKQDKHRNGRRNGRTGKEGCNKGLPTHNTLFFLQSTDTF